VPQDLDLSSQASVRAFVAEAGAEALQGGLRRRGGLLLAGQYHLDGLERCAGKRRNKYIEKYKLLTDDSLEIWK
jgi:hypothetical protein